MLCVFKCQCVYPAKKCQCVLSRSNLKYKWLQEICYNEILLTLSSVQRCNFLSPQLISSVMLNDCSCLLLSKAEMTFCSSVLANVFFWMQDIWQFYCNFFLSADWQFVAQQQFCGTCGCMSASPTAGRQASRSTSTFSKGAVLIQSSYLWNVPFVGSMYLLPWLVIEATMSKMK